MVIHNCKRYILLLALFIPLVSCGEFAVSEDPKLVFDPTAASGVIPKKYRTNQGLNVSASGQFSAAELQQMLQAIPIAPQKIWIVDLRQESHGFINGMPISWYNDQNTANKNKTPNQIARQEKTLLENLRHDSTVTVYTLNKLDDGKSTAIDPITLVSHLIESEEELVTKLNANYKRFYILDHHRPDDFAVDDYVNFVKNVLKPGEWLHFHCRGGKGRSSTFIVMYDMILNGKNTSFVDIMRRQEAMGNTKLDATPTKTGKLWKTGAARERFVFLQKFYAYVTDPNGYVKSNWTDWLSSVPAQK